MCCRSQSEVEVWLKRHSGSQEPPVWSGGPHRRTTPAGFLHKHQALGDLIGRADAVSE